MNSRLHPDLALKHLSEGAAFVLHPEYRRPNSRKPVLRMRMRLADGSLADGIWNYAKVRLERRAILKEGKSREGWRAWFLK